MKFPWQVNGNPTDSGVPPQLFEHAVLVWRIGLFERQKGVSAVDPGEQTSMAMKPSEPAEHRNNKLDPSAHLNVGA